MMSQVEQQVNCTTCQWNKNCISPPNMTEEEVKQVINKPRIMQEGDKPDNDMFGKLMTTLVFANKDKECPACPVFVERLRAGPELSQKIKDIMKSM